MPRRVLAAATIAATLVGIWLWSELVHVRSSRRRMGSRPRRGKQVVVVLGFGNRGRRANLVNRYRVRAGLRSFDPRAIERLLVLSGGAVGGPVPEADLMADVARDLGYRGPLARERESRSTWDNVRNSIPLLEDADAIVIASHSLHAEVARTYLRRLRPDLAERLTRGREQRLGEQLVIKPVAAIRGLRKLRRLSR